MPRFKRAALLIEDEGDDDSRGALLFEAHDSLDTGPRAHDVFAADLPTLRSLARGHGDVDDEVVVRWRGQVPGLIRDDTVAEELAELRRFAADRRFMLEFISATETILALVARRPGPG
jgi:hypothetical protein